MSYPLSTLFPRIEKAIAIFPKAAMFQLREQGYDSLFEQLISCLISIRTLDEVTIPVSLRLFQKARTPKALLQIPHPELADLLHGTQYPGQKAETMLSIARTAVEDWGGMLPANFEQLTSFKGIGTKCANLALGVAAGLQAISVDVHVHRVVNRWGLVATRTPEKTLAALESLVPKKDWTDVNRLLMPFGKHICTLHLPQCSTCPVLQWCKQVGVVRHR